MSDLRSKLFTSKLPPMPPAGAGPLPSKRRNLMKKRDYTPVKWDTYFDRSRNIEVDSDNIFHVYECGSEGPVCVFLHGGGFSGLSWALLSKHLTEIVKCRCLAIDLRGHGETETKDEADYSIDTQARDVGNVLQTLFGDNHPPIILIGHSMGGAVAVHTAHLGLVPSLIGLVVIDVVEGTALDALSGMQSVLRGRPNQFKSLEYAIEWCCRVGYIHNIESAKVSMIGQLKQKNSNEVATHLLDDKGERSEIPLENPVHETITEEDPAPDKPEGDKKPEVTGDAGKDSDEVTKDLFTWRIDLFKTQPYWREWFEGLSNKFLSIEAPKMLLLAGIDRLDKDLTIGQMQGKFQMQVLPKCGHAVHEDVPDKVADVIGTFMLRHKVAEAKSEFNRVFPAC